MKSLYTLSVFTLLHFLWTTITATPLPSPTVYLIRHGEKDANTLANLNPLGIERSQCLVNIFGRQSFYNIGYILAEDFLPDGTHNRPYLTVLPLANSLGLNIDHDCQRDQVDCVADKVKNYKGVGNILICWQHTHLSGIVEAMGNEQDHEYPEDDFGQIWTSPSPYTTLSVSNEVCPGLGQ